MEIKKVSFFRRIIPEVFAFITKKPRYLPEIKWSNKFWTHNVFRFYEMIFWRKEEVRPEIAMTFDLKKREFHSIAFTLEGQFALLETWVRNLTRVRLRIEKREFELAMPGGIKRSFRSYMFSTALDNDSSYFESGSIAYTCTGTNLLLQVGCNGDTSDDITGMTYNSVSMTLLGKNSNSNRETYTYYLLGPATGSNTISISGYAYGTGCIVSYSGVQQTSQPDAHTDATASSVTTKTQALTVVAANSWMTMFVGCKSGSSMSAGAGTTLRVSRIGEGTDIVGFLDSNAGLAAGSHSLVANFGATCSLGLHIASWVPSSNTFNRTMSDSLMNADSRAATVGSNFNYFRTSSASIMNGASRFVSLAGARTVFRTLSDSIFRAVAATTDIASYNESNQNSVRNLKIGHYDGESFTIGSQSVVVNGASFYLNKSGSPTGSIYAKIFALTGTPGTNAQPTGAALATSDPVDVSTVTGSLSLINFTFSGVNAITLAAATSYFIQVYNPTGDASNYLNVGIGTGSLPSGQNEALSSDGGVTWSVVTTIAVCYHIYSTTLRTVTASRVYRAIRGLSVSMFISVGREVIDFTIALWGFFFWD